MYTHHYLWIVCTRKCKITKQIIFLSLLIYIIIFFQVQTLIIQILVTNNCFVESVKRAVFVNIINDESFTLWKWIIHFSFLELNICLKKKERSTARKKDIWIYRGISFAERLIALLTRDVLFGRRFNVLNAMFWTLWTSDGLQNNVVWFLWVYCKGKRIIYKKIAKQN